MTEEDWFYLHKWVERGLFCDHTSAKTALEVIAYHPTAPWNNGRWDVDHKPYARKFYETFPKAAAQADRSPEGEKPQALNAKHESAVGSEASDAPNEHGLKPGSPDEG